MATGECLVAVQQLGGTLAKNDNETLQQRL